MLTQESGIAEKCELTVLPGKRVAKALCPLAANSRSSIVSAQLHLKDFVRS